MSLTCEVAAPETVRSFETEVCTRCAGSGRYSYCAMYGSTCFKCHGKGRTYSKRGEAALSYARTLRTVPASDVQVGWLYYVEPSPSGGYKSGWYPVLSVEPAGIAKSTSNGVTTEYQMVSIETRAITSIVCSDVQAVPNVERLREVKQLAFDYQDTLTKRGTIAKKGRAA